MGIANDHPITGYVHLLDVVPRPGFLQRWERLRHGSLHWLMECLGEFFGVFFYVYCGVGTNAAFNVGRLASEEGIGSLLTVGLGYAIGIVAAISIAGSVSGGHFNPCVTICQAIWRGFPWVKVLPFIVFQILGGYVACFIVYGQYRSTFLQIELALKMLGKYDTVQFTPNGVAGIFALYTQQGANLKEVFMNEFFADFFLGLVIWGALDPSNFFIPPPAAPWVIGFAYAVMIWGYAPVGLSANSARDVGGRLMAITVWGTKANGGAYAAIAALTNIPATLFATVVYELIFYDSSRVLPPAQQAFLSGHKAHLEHKHLTPEQQSHAANNGSEKSEVRSYEKV